MLTLFLAKQPFSFEQHTIRTHLCGKPVFRGLRSDAADSYVSVTKQFGSRADLGQRQLIFLSQRSPSPAAEVQLDPESSGIALKETERIQVSVRVRIVSYRVDVIAKKPVGVF